MCREERVALVTGASSGIGRAAALAFAREGIKVVACSRRKSEGEETVRMIREAGGEATFIQADVSKANEVEALIDSTVATYGRLDYAFNNAGIGGPITPMLDYTEENWNEVIDIDLKGTWLCMKHEITQMLKQGGGSIVNTASVAGLVGVDWGIAPYVAAKHGVVGISKAAALEYAQKNIRVNVICPAVIRTAIIEPLGDTEPLNSLHPMNRIGEPEEVAETALWLCSEKASFITGQTLAVDGGWTAR